MTQQLMTALGGLGLFLLGMVVMTDGLRNLAGDALHQWLARFTRSPATGALTGTVTTAVLQSSSAVTVTTVGFVAAGLMTFPQALGIVFGANLGTTITGWMVALLGFKLRIGDAALPVVLAGMLLFLFGRGAWKQFGRTLAGFGVVFLGIGFTQAGMEHFADVLSPERFPQDDIGGRLLLVAMGALFTVVTRSSSAGVAVALTALSQGAIHFQQAACMVIGMDVGTTVTAVLASLGSSVAARRTGFSHTIYNLFSAVGALLLLDAYTSSVNYFLPGAMRSSPELVLVGFHTLFNLLALLVGVPLARPFARLLERLVPGRDTSFSQRLDDRLLAEPAAAEAALNATLRDEFGALLAWTCRALAPRSPAGELSHPALYQDLRNTRDYLDRINSAQAPDKHPLSAGSAIHTLDHLRRMYWRLRQSDRLDTLRSVVELADERDRLAGLCSRVAARLESGIDEATFGVAEELAAGLRESSDRDRDRIISIAVERNLGVARTGAWLAGRRWLERMAHHVWRITAHVGGFAVEDGP